METGHEAGDDDHRNDNKENGARRHVAVLFVGGRVEEDDCGECEAGDRQVAEGGTVDGVEFRTEGR